jgi:hypothetical protein
MGGAFRHAPGSGRGVEGSGNRAVISLFMSLVMIAVVVLSLAFGVGLGYAIIFGILYIFDRSRRSVVVPVTRALNSSAGSN